MKLKGRVRHGIIVGIMYFILGMCVSNSVCAEEVAVVLETGKETGFSFSHTRAGEGYRGTRFGIRNEEGWELSYAEISGTSGRDSKFSAKGLGVGHVWNYQYSWFYTELSVGLKYFDKDRNNRWLMHKHLVADFGGSVGLKLGDFTLAYTLRHYSCPGDDPGMNLDSITIMFRRDF